MPRTLNAFWVVKWHTLNVSETQILVRGNSLTDIPEKNLQKVIFDLEE